MNVHNVVRLPTDVSKYYRRMESSMPDKLFFVERLPHDVTVFADFGCGDGSLLDFVILERPTCRAAIGYDISKDALRRASAKNPDGFWTPSFAAFGARIDRWKREGHKVCLVLSSVVHEVLASPAGFIAFWRMLRALECDYIAIRDMACEIDAFSSPAVDQDRLLESGLMRDVVLYGTGGNFAFQNRAEMLQALLKYRYEDDIHKELAENYFPLSAEQWLNATTIGSGYQLMHFDHYSLPFNRERWFDDFGVNVPDPTHIKILLKRI